jgi:hypothetical protein
MAGLTNSGFTVATTEELRTTISTSLKSNLGGDIDTNPSSRIGQFIDIMAENLSSLWQGLEAVYNSQYPSSASGTSLDNVGSITNTQRSPGRFGVARVYFNGTLGTVIPAGTVIANQNGYELTTTTSGTISNNNWLLYADLVPTSDKAEFRLTLNGDPCGIFEIFDSHSASVIKQSIVDAGIVQRTITNATRNGTIATITTSQPHGFSVGTVVTQTTFGGFFNGTYTITAIPSTTTYSYPDTATATTVSSGTTAGQILTSGEVIVLGQFNVSGGIWIQFTPLVSGRIYSIDLLTNDMFSQATAVSLTVANSTDTYVESIASVLQNQEIQPHSVIELVSAVSNIEAVVNIESGISGQQRATDAEYRIQLSSDLQNSNSNTVAGIKANLLSLIGVTFVGLIENATASTVSGRPPFSYEVFVEGGDDDEVAQKIYDTHPPGINIVTTDLSPRVGDYTDVNGTIQSLSFSNVQELNVYVAITGTKNSSYPANGDTLLIEAVMDYINSRQIGETLYQHNIFTPANTIPGIISMLIKMDTVIPTTGVTSITPTSIQRVYLSGANISVIIT